MKLFALIAVVATLATLPTAHATNKRVDEASSGPVPSSSGGNARPAPVYRPTTATDSPRSAPWAPTPRSSPLPPAATYERSNSNTTRPTNNTYGPDGKMRGNSR
jgi:hypothetical protein